ncbi:MAG: hypothetical protein OEO77_03235 [Acidimicrobiia bacterium]|nr:hypothetical protein [Acidimicrobiia bacterium]
MADQLRVEFLIEPFVEGNPGIHVMAAVDAFADRGLAIEFGPFGNTAAGARPQVLEALAAALDAAFVEGATRVTVHVATT